MAAELAQESCTALFPLWALRENKILKIKRNT